MLTECGHVRATASDGSEWSFTPSFGRIASLGDPHEIVSTFAALHGPKAEAEAAYVLACLCDQEDPTPVVGWQDEDGRHPGLMPGAEQVVIARHLMRHGIIGKAKPGKGDGKFSASFNAAEYVSAARVHLGLSSADAEALSMTEFQIMMEMKFPDRKEEERPTLDEYNEALAAIEKAKGRSNG